jgi:hypothetical protein
MDVSRPTLTVYKQRPERWIADALVQESRSSMKVEKFNFDSERYSVTAAVLLNQPEKASS